MSYERAPAEIYVHSTDSKRYPYKAIRAPRSNTDALRVGIGKTEAEAIADCDYILREPAPRTAAIWEML